MCCDAAAVYPHNVSLSCACGDDRADDFAGAPFQGSQQEEGISTAYGSDLNGHEENTWTHYMKMSLMISLPWQFSFVVFFPNAAKCLSCLWYALFFAGGGIAFRIKHGRRIMQRKQAQRDELEKQQKREELGKWK